MQTCIRTHHTHKPHAHTHTCMHAHTHAHTHLYMYIFNMQVGQITFPHSVLTRSLQINNIMLLHYFPGESNSNMEQDFSKSYY